MATRRTDGPDRIARVTELFYRIRNTEALFRSDASDEEKGKFVGEYDWLLAEWDRLRAEILEKDQDRMGLRLQDGSCISLRDALTFVMKYQEVLDVFGGVVVGRDGTTDAATPW